MNILQQMVRVTMAGMFVVALFAGAVVATITFAPPQAASAAACPNGTQPQADGSCVCPAGYQFVTQSVDANDTHCIPINANTQDITQNPIYFYLKNILRFLAAGIGLAVTGGIVFGGYLYITARANAGQVEQAKVVIINSVIGLLLFVFMYAILQFLIPGGIFT